MPETTAGGGDGTVAFRDGGAEPPAATSPPGGPSPPVPLRAAKVVPSPSNPPGSAPTPPTSSADKRIPLESVHAYLLLSEGWAIPQSKPEGLTYARWRRDGVDEICVPLTQVPGQGDAVPALIKAIAALEERPDKALAADLGRLCSMRTIRNGPFHALREGDLDPDLNKKITSMIMQSATFVVYLDARDDVVYVMSGDFGEFPKDYGKVVSRLSGLLAEPTDHLSAAVRRSFRTLLAEGIARLLDDRASENALAVFDKAESYLRDRSNEKARLIYLGATVPPTLLAIVAAVLLWVNQEALDKHFVNGFTVAAVAASMGAVGAFLSIFLRVTKVELDARAGTPMLVVECMLRVFVGVVVAAVVGWGINANFLLGFTSGMSGGWIGTKMLIGLLSGASERAMPTMMQKFDSTIESGAPGSDGGVAPKPKPKADQEPASGAGRSTNGAVGSADGASGNTPDPPAG